MAALAVLPVHAIYAGFILRESLVAVVSIVAVWMLTEVWYAQRDKRPTLGRPGRRNGGLAVLARTTGLALLVAAGSLRSRRTARRRFGPLLVWVTTAALVCLPWAWVTWREYQSPFYSYTSFSNIISRGRYTITTRETPTPSQFYTAENLPEIVRVKLKSLLLIIAVTSTMIVGLPVVRVSGGD